jgi:hypothetical protein
VREARPGDLNTPNTPGSADGIFRRSEMITTIVRFSAAAAIELILNAIGAYEAKVRNGASAVETTGQFWGYVNGPHRGVRVAYIDHLSPNVFADREPDQVLEDFDEVAVKAEAMNILRPELTLLGNFHTHPYRTVSEVKSAGETGGWHASPDDRRVWKDEHRNVFWRAAHDDPIFLILTLCRSARGPSVQRHLQHNMLNFQVAEFQLWLTAYAGYELDGVRRISRQDSASVALDLLPIKGAALEIPSRLNDWSPQPT